MMYSGLGDEGKRLLDEFSGTTSIEPIDTVDSEPQAMNEQPWEILGQEGIAQGFINDIQGLLDGK